MPRLVLAALLILAGYASETVSDAAGLAFSVPAGGYRVVTLR